MPVDPKWIENAAAFVHAAAALWGAPVEIRVGPEYLWCCASHGDDEPARIGGRLADLRWAGMEDADLDAHAAALRAALAKGDGDCETCAHKDRPDEECSDCDDDFSAWTQRGVEPPAEERRCGTCAAKETCGFNFTAHGPFWPDCRGWERRGG